MLRCVLIVECGIACFLSTITYSKFGHHPHPLGHLCAKFHFFCSLHCWASPWRKSRIQSISHSPSFFDTPGIRSFRFGKKSQTEHCCIAVIKSSLINTWTDWNDTIAKMLQWLYRSNVAHCTFTTGSIISGHLQKTPRTAVFIYRLNAMFGEVLVLVDARSAL